MYYIQRMYIHKWRKNSSIWLHFLCLVAVMMSFDQENWALIGLVKCSNECTPLLLFDWD